MKFLFYLLITLFVCTSLNAQGNTLIEQIESAYRSNTLNHSDSRLNIDVWDSDSVKAAKNYFTALLHSDFQQSIILHSTNFSTFPNELYGKKSGVKLISVDFINKGLIPRGDKTPGVEL